MNGSYAGSVTGYNNTPTRKVSHMSNTSSHRSVPRRVVNIYFDLLNHLST